MVWRRWTNTECLLRAHKQRLGISKEMLVAKREALSKVAINLGDNAPVNFKCNRMMHATVLQSFSNFEVGCRIHGTAIAKNRGSAHLIQDIITGQTNWAFCLNKGVTMNLYKVALRSVVLDWTVIYRGAPQFSNMAGQRQIMSLIFKPHSYVT